MHQMIDNTTRFFTVVGAPAIALRHADGDAPRRGSLHGSSEIATWAPASPAGSWLNDER